MNTYLFYFEDTKESHGPFQAICRDTYRLLKKTPWETAKQIFRYYKAMAVVDPNGSVILAHMLIDKIECDASGELIVSIVPRDVIFPHRRRLYE